MLVNADFTSFAAVDAGRAPWVPSPLPGVERCLLDRVGDEVARATSLVRFAPQSRFESHNHGGGEEFLVLEGVFSDPAGDFGPGSYVRNPPGTEHAPWSEPGCVIFVKLWQFQDGDDATVRIDTTDAEWRAASSDGVRGQLLHQFGPERVELLRFDGEASVELGTPQGGGVEVLVLDGEMRAGDQRHARWSWLRQPPGEALTILGSAGLRLFVKRGHLDPPVGL